MSIYDGPVPHKFRHKLKLMSPKVNVVSQATQEYLRWFESLTTLDQTGHPNYIPFIIDLLIETTRLTKALLNDTLLCVSRFIFDRPTWY
jgi:hypothetical protein